MKQIETSAGTIEYDEQGSGPVVVLLHGLLMDHTQWDQVLPLLPPGFRYVRPLLPLGSHRIPMKPDADLSLAGLVGLVAEILDVLDLDDVTLVHTDWGGALFLTARGLDTRIGRLVILPCETFDNFPPGLPGRMAALGARLPGGMRFAARQLRIGWLRKAPFLYGQMAKRPVPDRLMRRWTDPVLTDDGVLHDLLKYGREKFDKAALIADTEALRGFEGQALVLWSPECRAMRPAYGPRLAALLRHSSYVEIPDAYVLSMLDDPAAVAREMSAFLTAPVR